MRTRQEPLVILVRAWRDDAGVRGVVRTTRDGAEVPVGSLEALCEVLDGTVLAWAHETDAGEEHDV